MERVPGADDRGRLSVDVVRAPADPVPAFTRWVASVCTPGCRVLDVGAGTNASGPLRPILATKPHLVCLDPDASVHDNPMPVERVQATVEEYAARSPEPFDVAFAVYVLEHVAEPEAFLTGCAQLLRPGGSFFALTLNVRHYFGATTWALTRLHLEERTLHRLKGSTGHHHHFPTAYRLNSVRALERSRRAAGFASGEVRAYDATANYAWYLPRGTGWVAPAWSRMAYAVGSPSLMGHLSLRLVR
jgi:SAM-dependent methyltransferase